MSNSKADALYISWSPSGFVTAEASSFQAPITITEIKNYPVTTAGGDPFVALEHLRQSKKGYRKIALQVSSDEFLFATHEVDSLIKAKEPDYFPNVIKSEFVGIGDDIFYHVINSGDGGPYSPNGVTEKNFILSVVGNAYIESVQQRVTNHGLYPHRLESSTLATLGMLKQLSGEQSQPCIALEVFEDKSSLLIVPTEGPPVFQFIDTGIAQMCQQVQDALSLKDKASARKLLYSSTIDLSDIGDQVVQPLRKEIAATIGLYEVETGQSITRLFVTNMAAEQSWINQLLAEELGLNLFDIDHVFLMNDLGIQWQQGLEWNRDDPRMIPLFAMMQSE